MPLLTRWKFIFRTSIGANKKESMRYLKIDIKEVEFLVNSYENWYNTFDKDGYKYVIEQLNFDQKYYDQLLSSLHNFVKGGEFYPIKKKVWDINIKNKKSF